MFKRILAKPLEPRVVEALITAERDDLLHICDPETIFLFGSAARGEMTDASDLDLLVVLKDDADFKTIKRQYYCRKKSHMFPVDIIFMSMSDFVEKSKIGGVAMICQKEGRILYGKRP